MLLFNKAIDKSVFHYGFAIPVVHKELLFKKLGMVVNPGDTYDIYLSVDGVKFPAKITSINFNRRLHPNRQDMVQVRYNENSSVAKKLREKFEFTYSLIASNPNYTAKWLADRPENEKEFIAVYSSNESGTLILDCISNKDFVEETKELVALGETYAEAIFNQVDLGAEIVLKTKLCKVRHLVKKIGEDLKKLYGYRCQICGCSFEEPYDTNLIHAHHIDYFVKSQNNNPDNIMILCPNHHGIIHALNPVFDRKRKVFIYPNGYEEPLKLNKHL